jgi:Trp operon repressor
LVRILLLTFSQKKKKMRNLIIALLITFKGYSQQVNRTNDGYTEVVEVELSKKEIHQKLNEWIAVNYKSANDVVQLNTEDKVIVKGNYSVVMSNLSYRVSKSLVFSIRDNKYKVDLIPSSISSSITTIDASASEKMMQIYIPKMLDREVYNEIAQKNGITYLKSLGWSDKKIAKKFLNKPTEEIYYNNYVKDKKRWDNAINSTFKSIKDYLNKSKTEEDW